MMHSTASAASSVVSHRFSVEDCFTPRDEARLCRREFEKLTWLFAINHAAVTLPVPFAAAVLEKSIGHASNAVLFGTTLICSLFLANPVVALLGPKKSLTVAMTMYSLYAVLFAFACRAGSLVQFWCAIVGAMSGGIGSALMWTTQGILFATACQRVAAGESKEPAVITAGLGARFGLVYLGCECGLRLLTTCLTRWGHVELLSVFSVYGLLAFGCAMSFSAMASNIARQAQAPQSSMCAKVMAVMSLWSDPKLWLLQCTNITFGIAAAWMNGYVNSDIIAPALGGQDALGLSAALLSATAGSLSGFFGPLAANMGKGVVVIIGSMSFLLLGLWSNAADEPEQWGHSALIFCLLMGLGRAVYESTNKAIFVDFFPGEKSAGAFANNMVFSTGASTVTFALGAMGITSHSFNALVVFACLTYPCFLAASRVRQLQIDRQISTAMS